MLYCSLLFFINFVKIFFQEYYQSVKYLDQNKAGSSVCNGNQQMTFVCLFDLILYVPSTIFQLNRDGSFWVEPVLS